MAEPRAQRITPKKLNWELTKKWVIDALLDFRTATNQVTVCRLHSLPLWRGAYTAVILGLVMLGVPTEYR